MSFNRGKQFEQQFSKCWGKSFPNTFLYRLKDQQSGYYGTSKNLCDFFAYVNRTLFLIECKSVEGNTFPLTNLSQYDDLLEVYEHHYEGIRIGVVVWFYDRGELYWVPISTFKKLRKDGLKSFNARTMTTDQYFFIPIPATKLRIQLNADYKVLLQFDDEGNHLKETEDNFLEDNSK